MSEEVSEKRCPKCGALNSNAELTQREYRCADCGLELVHLDTNAQGAIRGVFGWILDVGAEINGRYRVTAVLGKGGFGVTYLVDDLRLHGKRRALKEIPEALFDEYETRLLGRLSHPAIPDITDRFTDSGMVYLVLEFGGDRTLRIEQERRGGRIPIFVLLPWIRQLCEALQYLHQQDPPVVHRDLKPDNILLDDNDRIMLIDFGIAKEATPDSATRTLGRAVTHGFSPPEQVLGTGTDARSDVYALGAIVYNLLTDRKPAPAHERITGATIEPLSRFLPDIPPLIEAAVMKSLELNINLRQQSIEELVQVFDLVQSGTGSAATICVSGPVATQVSSTTGEEVVLPSVQLPTAPSSPSSGRARTSMRIAPRDVASAPVAPKRSRSGLFALVVAVVAAAGGGYWYLDKEGFIARIAGEEEVQDEPQTAIEPPATPPTAETADATTAVKPAGFAATEAARDGAPSAPDAAPTADAGIGSPTVAVEPAAPDTERAIQAPDGKTIVQEPVAAPASDSGAGPRALAQEPDAGQAIQVPDGKEIAPASDDLPAADTGAASPAVAEETPVPVAGTDASAASADEAPVAASDGKGAAAAATGAAAVASRRSAAPSGLPSIYSNEQNAATVPVKRDSGRSLFDVFQKHRGESRAEQPVATVAPPPKKVAPKKSTTTTKTKPKTKSKTRKTVRAKRKSAPSNAAAWGFKYKGSEKK